MDNRPIAIIDSGLGGLIIAQSISKKLPQESILYLADHKFFPYGDKTYRQINRRLIRLVNFLLTQNVKAIVIACNTITTASIKMLRALFPILFIGTEPAIKLAVEKNLKENIVVLATVATAQSKSFKKLIDKFDKKGKVLIKPCPGLAEDIENLNLDNLENSVKKFLKIDFPYSVLVLGCTHYILIKELIKKLTPPQVIIIEPSQAIANQTEKILAQSKLLSTQTPVKKIFLTTGNTTKATKTAKKLLKESIIFTKCSI